MAAEPSSRREPVAVGDYPGIHVEFHEKPYRHYLVNGEKAVSVTTALGVLAKNLDSWVERTTLAGAWTLARDTTYSLPVLAEVPDCPWRGRKYVPNFAKRCNTPAHDCVGGDPALCQFRVDLKTRKLDFYASKKGAADRGVDVHKVWQDWNEKKKIPNASEYPRDRHGFIRGLAKFIMEYSPECIESEQVVGSAEHMFAGRLDTVVVLRVAEWGTCMIDIKTGKGIYPDSHFPQLRGYKIARAECGLVPTDREGILSLKADGKYELGWSDDPKYGGPTTDDDFLSVLAAYRSHAKWKRP